MKAEPLRLGPDLLLPVQTTHWIEPVTERMIGLLRLRSNWDSYGAKWIAVRAVMGTLLLLRDVMGPDTSVPHVIPAPHGGINLEWSRGGYELEIETTDGKSFEALYVTPDEHFMKCSWGSGGSLVVVRSWLSSVMRRGR